MFSQREESWDLLRIDGNKVGYAYSKIEPFEENGRQLVRLEMEMQLALKRFGQVTNQRSKQQSVETRDGELLRCESRETAGRDETVVVAKVDGDKLQLEITTAGKAATSHIPWRAEWGGFFGPELSLRKKPLKPGEKRTLTALMPVINKPCEVRLEATVKEAVKLLDGSAMLLKIRRVDVIGVAKLESSLWVNEQGEVIKTFLPSLGLESIRCSKEVALDGANKGSFDLGTSSVVPVKGKLTNPHAAKRIVYKATLKDGAIATAFASGASQSVDLIDEHTAKITVVAVRPTQPTTLTATEPPAGDDDRKPNAEIQSDDERIVKMSRQFAADETDEWKIATAAEAFVKRTIHKKNFSQVFASAAEVAESLEGDCTEHSVLLAALCRARKIPARVAIGLVHFPPANGFAYHMWTEAWVNQRWIPLDATLGQAGIGGGHIKLAATNLSHADGKTAFVAVAQVMRQLELEVLEQE